MLKRLDPFNKVCCRRKPNGELSGEIVDRARGLRTGRPLFCSRAIEGSDRTLSPSSSEEWPVDRQAPPPPPTKKGTNSNVLAVVNEGVFFQNTNSNSSTQVGRLRPRGGPSLSEGQTRKSSFKRHGRYTRACQFSVLAFETLLSLLLESKAQVVCVHLCMCSAPPRLLSSTEKLHWRFKFRLDFIC